MHERKNITTMKNRKALDLAASFAFPVFCHLKLIKYMISVMYQPFEMGLR